MALTPVAPTLRDPDYVSQYANLLRANTDVVNTEGELALKQEQLTDQQQNEAMTNQFRNSQLGLQGKELDQKTSFENMQLALQQQAQNRADAEYALKQKMDEQLLPLQMDHLRSQIADTNFRIDTGRQALQNQESTTNALNGFTKDFYALSPEDRNNPETIGNLYGKYSDGLKTEQGMTAVQALLAKSGYDAVQQGQTEAMFSWDPGSRSAYHSYLQKNPNDYAGAFSAGQDSYQRYVTANPQLFSGNSKNGYNPENQLIPYGGQMIPYKYYDEAIKQSQEAQKNRMGAPGYQQKSDTYDLNTDVYNRLKPMYPNLQPPEGIGGTGNQPNGAGRVGGFLQNTLGIKPPQKSDNAPASPTNQPGAKPSALPGYKPTAYNPDEDNQNSDFGGRQFSDLLRTTHYGYAGDTGSVADNTMNNHGGALKPGDIAVNESLFKQGWKVGQRVGLVDANGNLVYQGTINDTKGDPGIDVYDPNKTIGDLGHTRLVALDNNGRPGPTGDDNGVEEALNEGQGPAGRFADALMSSVHAADGFSTVGLKGGSGQQNGVLAAAHLINQTTGVNLNTSSVNAMYQDLRAKATQVALANVTPGTVLISPSKNGNPGAVGIMGQDGKVFANNTKTNVWEASKDFDQWQKAYMKKNGVYAFQVGSADQEQTA